MAFVACLNALPARTRRRSVCRRRPRGARPRVAVSAVVAEPEPEPDDPARSAEGVQALLDGVQDAVDRGFDAFFSPLIDSCSVLQRQWEVVGGNYILRPAGRAKAVIHFIGGAFFGASPHIAYRTLLERLAQRGYCIVAAPYDLSFDYLQITSGIVQAWEKVETDLAVEYGAVPVIGLGHSAGCVFHCLASSLFDDVSPKAANIFISFNNRSASAAIPLYKQLVTPIARQSIVLNQLLPPDLQRFIDELPETLDAVVEGSVLTPRRFKDNVLPTVKEGRRVVEQVWPLLEEIAGMGEEGSSGDSGEESDDAEAQTRAAELKERRRRDGDISEFYPSPAEVKSAVRNLYAVTDSLVIKFANDTLDDSEDLADAIRKRGGGAEITMMELDGSHLTPLVQEVPDLFQASAVRARPRSQAAQSSDTAGGTPPADGAGGGVGGMFSLLSSALNESINAMGTKELYALESLIDEWIEAGIASDRL